MGLRLGCLLARRLIAGLMLLARSESSKDAEILVLRHQGEVRIVRSRGRGWRGWTGW